MVLYRVPTVSGSYTIIRWYGSGSQAFTVPTGVTSIEYLVVAGGGAGAGGASPGGGGGGAGGMKTGSVTVTPGNVHTITCGAGGTIVLAGMGNNGGSSSFGTLISCTGGGGAGLGTTGSTGGSGGANSGGNVSGEGNIGGTGQTRGHGGGGGKSAAGSPGNTGTGGNGGDGTSSSITGSAITYAGGGAGGGENFGATGGAGGGGNSGAGSSNGVSGTLGLGGGGGGSYTGYPGNGGAGTVILKFLTATPVAAFSGSPLQGTVPFSVQFTDASTNWPTAWSWTFGDTGTSSTQSPAHQYTVAGTYTVTLTAANTAGSDGETKTAYIQANSSATAPVAAFSGTNLSNRAPMTVQFTDATTNTPTSWLWNFGDGTTSTAQSPSHIYHNPGKYTVTLTATNAAGSDGETKTDYVYAFADYLTRYAKQIPLYSPEVIHTGPGLAYPYMAFTAVDLTGINLSKAYLAIEMKSDQPISNINNCQLELTSAGASDSEEITWDWRQPDISTEWRSFLFPLSGVCDVPPYLVPSNNGFDPSSANFIRMYGFTADESSVTLGWRNARIVYPKIEGYADLFNGCIAYWDMAGDGRDCVGGHDGTVTGATLTTDRNGLANRAYNFAANQRLAVANSADFNFGTGDFTILAYLQYNTTFGTYGTYCSLGYYTGGILFRQNSGTQLGAHLQYASASDYYYATFSPSIGEDHLVGVTRKDGYIHFTVDGVLVGSSAASAQNIQTGSYTSMIGASTHSSGSENLLNPIDYVIVFDRGLDDTEVKAIYDLTKSGNIYPISRSDPR